MFNCLKKFFKPKLDTIPQKVEYLLKRDLNLYKTTLITDDQEFIGKNISSYILELNNIATSNFTTEYINVKNITKYNIYHSTYAKWLAGSNHISKTVEEDIKAWLDVSLKVYYLYQIGSVDIANTYSSNNSRKIYPYIINIESILDDLLSMYL